MALSGDGVVTLVLVVLIAQTVYYTVLTITTTARISSRLAVMEFKVNKLEDMAQAAEGRF